MTIDNLIDPSTCLRLVLTLGHFLWQAAAVGLAAAVAYRLLRRRSAQVRYAVMLSALAMMAICPALTYPLVHPPQLPQPSQSSGAMLPSSEACLGRSMVARHVSVPADTYGQAARRGADVNMAQPPASPNQLDSFSLDRFRPFAPHVAVAYLLGVAAMLARLLLGVYGGRRLGRLSRPVEDGDLLAGFARQARRLGLRFTPAVAASKVQLKAMEDIEQIRGRLTPEFVQLMLQTQSTLADAQIAEAAALANYNSAMADLSRLMAKTTLPTGK